MAWRPGSSVLPTTSVTATPMGVLYLAHFAGIYVDAVFALVLLFLEPVKPGHGCGGHEGYVWMMALAVAIDAYSCIPFAYLRYKKRPVRFAMLKLVNIGLNIVLNIFFLLICPWLMRVAPGWVGGFMWPISA